MLKLGPYGSKWNATSWGDNPKPKGMFKNGQLDGKGMWDALMAAKQAEHIAQMEEWNQKKAENEEKAVLLEKLAQKTKGTMSKKVDWGELSKISSGGYDFWGKCWRCGSLFKSKSSWKVWPQGPTCLDCRQELENLKQKGYSAGDKNSNFEAQQKPMKNGEIKKMSTTALWTDQWLVMGTAKAPYVVSKKTKTGEWQCSCPDWAKPVPRVDCKHILKVKLQEGVSLTKPKDANIFDSVKTTTTGNQGVALPAPKGRKFR